MERDRRGLRFPFDAAAEIALESSPSATLAAHVTQLSLTGCYLETPAPFEAKTPVLVKIFHEAEYFESKATVLYVKSASGMGVAFRDVKPHSREILQKWILAAMRQQKKPEEET